MPKRKAVSDEKQGAKKPRAAAAAAAADDGKSLDAAIAHAQLTPHTAVQTLKLVDAIKATEGSYTQRMQTVVDLIKADADRPDSLIDLSLVVEGEKVSQLISTGGSAAANALTRNQPPLTVTFACACATLLCSVSVVCAVSAAALLSLLQGPFRQRRREGGQSGGSASHSQTHWPS
jgi:hypothetical protein